MNNPIPSQEATAELSDERLKELGYAVGDRNNRFIDIPQMRAAIAADRAQHRPPTVPEVDRKTEREAFEAAWRDRQIRSWWGEGPPPDGWGEGFKPHFFDGWKARSKACFATSEPARDAEAPAATKEGWKLVPIEPTDDMLVLGQEAWMRKRGDRPAMEDCEEAEFVYRAMLAAAPIGADK